LSEEMSNSCEGKIASDECLLALKEFENGKSPGLDGFTAEFYKFFWKELRENLTSSLNHAFEKGELSVNAGDLLHSSGHVQSSSSVLMQ